MTETIERSSTRPVDYITGIEDLLAPSPHEQWTRAIILSSSTRPWPFKKDEPFLTVLPSGMLFPTMSTLGIVSEWLHHLIAISSTGRPAEPLLSEARGGLRQQLEKAAESSTALDQQLIEFDDELCEAVEAAFAAGTNETFEDGMISAFSEDLDYLISKFGKSAIGVISHLILNDKVNPEVASEALRCIGRIDHKPTYAYRRWLLGQSLSCSSSMVRDGAGLGISYMDDPDAINDIKKAIEREKIDELRDDLELGLKQLEETERCRGS